MAEENSKINSLSRIVRDPLLILGVVIMGVGYLFWIERADRQIDRTNYETRMERIVDKTVTSIDNNTRAVTDQKGAIHDLEKLIESKHK